MGAKRNTWPHRSKAAFAADHPKADRPEATVSRRKADCPDPTGRFGEIDEDGCALGQCERAVLGGMVYQHGHLGIGIERPELRRFLPARTDVDGMKIVVEPELLERDRNLDAVGVANA